MAFVLTASPALYLIGAGFTALGYAWLVPSKGHVARDGQQIRDHGNGVSLLDALTATTGAAGSPA